MSGLGGSNARLIGLNLGLLGVLGALTVIGATHAGAQPGTNPPAGAAGPARGRGEYTMIAGRVQGATTDGVFIIDAANQELVALSWDRTNNRLEPIGYRSIGEDGRYFIKPR
jgi:hypothetical protein